MQEETVSAEKTANTPNWTVSDLEIMTDAGSNTVCRFTEGSD
jgi:hypothetical protein